MNINNARLSMLSRPKKNRQRKVRITAPRPNNNKSSLRSTVIT